MQTEVLAARLDVLGVVLTEIARVLPAAQAAQAREAIGCRIADMMESKAAPEIDEAMSAQLVPLLAALRVSAH